MSSTNATDTVVILGRDATGLLVAAAHGMRWYLTDCCHAAATGTFSGIACKGCYRDAWAEGGLPEQSGAIAEPFGDGIPSDVFCKGHAHA